MKVEYYLKLPKRPPVAIGKSYFTVGTGPGYDLSLDGMNRRIAFSLRTESGGCHLIPGDGKLRLNGRAVYATERLNACDRLEWDGNTATLVDWPSESPGDAAPSRSNPLQILTLLNERIHAGDSVARVLQQTLAGLVEYAGADAGALVVEAGSGEEWQLLASLGTIEGAGSKQNRLKALVSHTVLTEAISSREPVYVESLIGHRWEQQASILAARIFSVSCIPLLASGRVFGALFLHTSAPGRVIRRDSLGALKIVASHTAMLLSQRKGTSEAKSRGALLGGAADIVYHPSDPMTAVVERVEKLGAHDLSILIRGETGTGKELVARDLHRRSARAQGPFVAVNCAAVPPTLMESILFGHAKGAFTGADRSRPGKFAQADKGTLFLDEIGDLSAELQAKLLRALQEKEVEPVGALESQSIDIRVLAATHQDMEALVRSGKFRKDLYFRLAGAVVTLPPLRERGADAVLFLAEHFLRRHSSAHTFSADAKVALTGHRWPGNVRQLEQVISRAVVLSSQNVIDAAALELECGLDDEEEVETLSSSGSLREVKQRFTDAALQQALARSGGNRQKAAASLGISERTLYRMLAASLHEKEA